MENSEHQTSLENILSRMESARRLYDEATPASKVYFQRQMGALKIELHELIQAKKNTSNNSVDAIANLPSNEKTRLSSLKQLALLDSPFEHLFDSITELAAHICGTPIALITIVDEDRQWFKSNYGLVDTRETPRDHAFCSHAILNDELMEVPDATQDPRFENNPLVIGNPDIRFYAGAPLSIIPGVNLGTLCVIDRVAGYLTPHQKTSLKGLAKVVSEALLLRHELNTELPSEK